MSNTDSFKKVFKALDTLNTDASILSENSLSVVKEYIDTGSMALNAIISGSLYGGIPEGRIVGISGPQQSGKTLILNKIIANKQKKDPEAWGVIWDSEAAYDENTVTNVGGDPSRIKICPVESVEKCRNEIGMFLDSIIETPELHGKVIIGIDSLGNLASEKELDDVRKAKDAVDMGMRAKAMKSMMRCLTYKALKANVTIVFTNHIYDNPSMMYPSMVKDQSGGKAPLYLASVLVQLSTTHNKDEKSIISPLANKVSGIMLKATTIKNRIIPAYLATELDLNFKTGLYRYSGLLDMAVAYGVVQKDKNTYIIGDKRLGFASAFKDDKELWETEILPQLDEKLKKELKYGSVDNNEELEKLVCEVNNIEEDI